MFCLSCGKKISKLSKFCKYCGSGQIIKKGIIKKGYETVWTCDYCKMEFDSKSNNDQHEITCTNNPKNKKFPFNNSPKRAWIFFWLTTISVFIISCVVANYFVESISITILNRDFLAVMFFANILIGILAFFGIAFSSNKPKNNKTSKVVKYILFICLGYLVINPSIFAIEGLIAKQNGEYKNKYYSKPTPSPAPQDSTEKLLKDLNDYRSEQKLSTLTSDEEMCKVAERLAKKEGLTGALKESDYVDLCPKCNGIGYAFVENYSLNNVFPRFKEVTQTNKVIDSKNYKYACFAISGQRVLLSVGNKSSASKTNTVATNNSSNLECIGPDGKHFNTTMDECKKLADKWGKPLDYMLDCNIHPDCGGGTVRMSYSQCMKPCSGLPDKTTNNNNSSPPVVTTSTQNNSSKVAFQATETIIKGTYYCYDNKVNSMVTQQSYVKLLRENYELCTKDSTRIANSSSCYSSSCSGKTGKEYSDCSLICYNEAFGECNERYKTYLEERSKLDSMRWTNCP